MRLLLALVLAVQASGDPFLNRLAGNWAGTGMVLNQQANISMSWTWELGGQFLRLQFTNQMPKSTFEGQAFYRPVVEGRYRGMWFDNAGMFRPLDAHRDGDALIAKWGTPQTEEGETTYRLMSDTRMDIIDRVKSKDGTWREFGRSTVERKR